MGHCAHPQQLVCFLNYAIVIITNFTNFCRHNNVTRRVFYPSLLHQTPVLTRPAPPYHVQHPFQCCKEGFSPSCHIWHHFDTARRGIPPHHIKHPFSTSILMWPGGRNLPRHVKTK